MPSFIKRTMVGEKIVVDNQTLNLNSQLLLNNFYIITNHNNSSNYKIVKTSISKTSIDNWENFIDHRENVLIEDIDVFDKFYVISERTNGLNRLLVKSWNNSFTTIFCAFFNFTNFFFMQ